MDTVATRLAINRPHPLFAAEVTGIDLSGPVARDDFRMVWEVFNEHELLVFRIRTSTMHYTTIAGKTPDSAFAVMPEPLAAY